MKKLIATSVIALLLAGSGILTAQDYPKEYLGLPGDNLNLYAVMDLFRESATLESFERSLNNPEKVINNLDLNGDNYVDYIMVKDYVDGTVHNIVLSVALNATETQDVAVFTVENLGNGSVWIQLIGDEALYGKNYIIEPIYDETPNPGYKGNAGQPTSVKVVTTTYYQVAAWPVVQYIFVPTYAVYYSPWYWGYYPVYWSHWSPYYWHYYYGYHYHWYDHYYCHYRPWPHYRYSGYNNFYYKGVRHQSPQVVAGIRNGHYKSTYSRPEELSRGKNEYERVYGARDANTSGNVSPNSRTSAGRTTDKATTAGKGTPEVRENRTNTSPSTQVRSTDNRSNPRVQSPAAEPRRNDAAAKPGRTSTAPSEVKSASVTRNKPEHQASNRSATAPKASENSRSVKSTEKASPKSSVKSQSGNGSRSSATEPARKSSQDSRDKSTGKGSSRQSSGR